MEPGSSPLVGGARQGLADTYPQAKFSSWSAIPLQQIHDGAELGYGAAHELRLDLSRARVVPSLASDLLAALPGTLPAMRDWAEKRDPANGRLARLYAVETNLTVTGMNADHRLRLKPTHLHRFGLALLGLLAPQDPTHSRHATLQHRFPLPPESAKFA